MRKIYFTWIELYRKELWFSQIGFAKETGIIPETYKSYVQWLRHPIARDIESISDKMVNTLNNRVKAIIKQKQKEIHKISRVFKREDFII